MHRAPELAQRRGCWELAGKRKWPVRGPGRAEVQEEGRALSRDPGWRRLIHLWTRSWRWAWGPCGRGAEEDPKQHRPEALLSVPLSFGQREELGWSFCLEDGTI